MIFNRIHLHRRESRNRLSLFYYTVKRVYGLQDESMIEMMKMTKDTIKMAESAMAQASDVVTKYGEVAIRTDEFNRRLAKVLLLQCVTFCISVSITAVLIAGIYFIGYSNYPTAERSVEYVGADSKNSKEDSRKNISEETQTSEVRGASDAN